MGAAVHGMLWSEVTSQVLWAFTQPQGWCGTFPCSAGAGSCMSTHQCPQTPAQSRGTVMVPQQERQSSFEPFPTGRSAAETQSKESPAAKQPRQDDPTQISKRQLHPPAPPVWLT